MSQAAAPPRPASHLVWLLALRPRTLPAAVVPVAVGTALAAAAGPILWLRAALCGGCALCIQMGTNLYNDYADHARGADTAGRVGPARATQRGWLSPAAVRLGAVAAFAAALLGGIYLVYVAGWPIAVLGLLSVALGVGYTGGPYPLAYHGLGEIFVFAFFGLAATGGTYYVQTLRLSWATWGLGGSIGALACAILVVNNLRDVASDAAANKITLAVRLGPSWSRLQYLTLLAVAYVLPTVLVAVGQGSGAWLLVYLSAPMALQAGGAIYRLSGSGLNVLLGRTALLELIFGLLLCIGILI